jgi:hypothetical protein
MIVFHDAEASRHLSKIAMFKVFFFTKKSIYVTFRVTET